MLFSTPSRAQTRIYCVIALFGLLVGVSSACRAITIDTVLIDHPGNLSDTVDANDAPGLQLRGALGALIIQTSATRDENVADYLRAIYGMN